MSQSIKLGLALGLTTMGRWRGEASMYFYPSLLLPVLPEWDRVKYPYAVIRIFAGTAYLVVLPSATYTSSSGLRGIKTFGGQQCGADVSNLDSGWGAFESETNETAFIPLNAFGNIVWSNFDILNEDGSVYLSALTPVPAGNGLAAYQGVKLPKLPEWDKTAYPYAVIYQEIGYYLGELRETNALYCFAEPLQWNYLLGYVTDNPGIRLRSQYIPTSGDTTWGEFTEEEYDEISGLGQAWAGGSLMWAWSNHDITNYSDGTVYIAGFEPIPIYE